MDAEITPLYSSGFYRILDFKCRCTDCRTSKPEYSNAFCISFVRKGNFLFNVFRRSLDSYTGCVLVTKPGYERTVSHIHEVPDECTIFEFSNDFFPHILNQYTDNLFFHSNDIHSTLIKTDPHLEYLHHHILELVGKKEEKLHIDTLVIGMIEKVLQYSIEASPGKPPAGNLKKMHLQTIENAKHYIISHFSENISLEEIAKYCCVSPFHFTRIFKTFTHNTPYRFLCSIRLEAAAMMLRTSSLPVMDIAFNTGFNSVEHFTTAFRQQFKIPPGVYRNSLMKYRITNTQPE